MNGKTILITDNETNNILCIIKTTDIDRTKAAIAKIMSEYQGAWSLEDILEELRNKYIDTMLRI